MAPAASMYLDPRGEVRVCCQNEWLRLGNITEQSLSGMWRGERMGRLRSAIARGDYALGCELCNESIDSGGAASAYARVFDHLNPDPEALEWPRQLELALSNACNLRCVMCNGELSSAIRIHREGRPPLPAVYGEEFFEELDEFLPHLESVVFLGGEPFLGAEPLRVMDRLVQMGLGPRCSVTTNGTQLSRRVEDLVTALPMHVTISVDSVRPQVLTQVRVGVDPELLMRNVERFSQLTSRTGGSMSLAFCMMRTTWRELAPVLEWADSIDLDVFVNEVAHPARWSLMHAPLADLESVIRELEQVDNVVSARLGRNASVWSAQLDRLRGMLSDRVAPGSEPTMVDIRAHARSLVEEPASDSLVAIVRTDSNQIVRDVEHLPGREPDLQLHELLGGSMWGAVKFLCDALGEVQHTDLKRHEDGIELRRIDFASAHRSVSLHAAMAPEPDGGQTWHFALRPLSGD